jgi:hypothetical protein
MEGFRATGQASSPDELTHGVTDFDARVIRTVNLSVAAQWRSYHWNDFRDQVQQSLGGQISGYLAARANGRSKQINNQNAQIFAEAMRSVEVRKFVVSSTFFRALLLAGQQPWKRV